MSLEEAIEQAKVQEQEKEAISLKVPAQIKQKLQKIAEENSVSMNNLISSILNDVLNGSVSNNAYELYNEFKKVSDDLLEITDPYGVNIDKFSINPRAYEGNESYIYSLVDRYNVLKNLLGIEK